MPTKWFRNSEDPFQQPKRIFLFIPARSFGASRPLQETPFQDPIAVRVLNFCFRVSLEEPKHLYSHTAITTTSGKSSSQMGNTQLKLRVSITFEIYLG